MNPKCKIVVFIVVVLAIALLIVDISRKWFSNDETYNKFKIVPLGHDAADIGKGPIWDEEIQKLLYVDIFLHKIWSFDPITKTHSSVLVDTEDPLTQIAKVKGENNTYIIALKNHLAKVTWDGESSEKLTPLFLLNVEDHVASTRLNGGKCDPSNRIWTGTMGGKINGTEEYEQGKGSLYMINHDKSVVRKESNIGISNGMAWSADKMYMYYIDSLTRKVFKYDYNDTDGSLSNKRVLFDFPQNKINGLTDGMNIDNEGMLWITSFGGAKVVRVNPTTGELLQILDIPAQQVCSVQFGGPNLDILYVTTAKAGLSQEDVQKYPYSGYMFEVTGLGIKGTPSVPVELETM